MYLRTREEAMAAIGAFLALPDPRLRRFEATLRLLQCLQPVPRALVQDAQTFLIDGGLVDLRRRRHELLRKDLPLIALEEGGLEGLEDVAAGLDALRLGSFVRSVFPDCRAERWRIARVALHDEASVRDTLLEAFHAGGHPNRIRRAQGILWNLTVRSTPSWNHRCPQLRALCQEALRTFPQPPDPDRFPLEAELLFELTTLSDERARAILEAPPSDAARTVHHVEELALEVRSLPSLPPDHPGPGQSHAVA